MRKSKLPDKELNQQQTESKLSDSKPRQEKKARFSPGTTHNTNGVRSNFNNGNGYNRGNYNQHGGYRQQKNFREERYTGGGSNSHRNVYSQRFSMERKRDDSRTKRFYNGERRPSQNRPQMSDSNIVTIRGDQKPMKFYVFLAKQLFYKEKYQEVVLIGVSRNIFNVLKVAQMLTNFKYATVSKIKTKSFTSRDNMKMAKVEITLTKTHDFEELYE